MKLRFDLDCIFACSLAIELELIKERGKKVCLLSFNDLFFPDGPMGFSDHVVLEIL
jgi:hypothetical protein